MALPMAAMWTMPGIGADGGTEIEHDHLPFSVGRSPRSPADRSRHGPSSNLAMAMSALGIAGGNRNVRLALLIASMASHIEDFTAFA